MTYHQKIINYLILVMLLFLVSQQASSQFISAGDGSYTTQFPGTDEVGRNSFPSGSPQISGEALGKPVPTNDWWSALVKENHVQNLFNYPMAMRTTNNGLVVSYISPASTPNGSTAPIGDALPVIVGVSGLNASQTTVSDFSDWTVTMNWSNSDRLLEATTGIGMPFIYFNKNSNDVAQITVNEGTVTVDDEVITITNSHQGSDFAIYAPSGSTWTQSGKTYSSSLNGENYWSMAYLPSSTSDIQSLVDEYQKYAYVFPKSTTTSWSFDENTSKLRTQFLVETEIKEGTESKVLLGLLPHQWDNLAQDSEQPNGHSYNSIRGELKTLSANEFSVENTFKGILPTLPYVNNYSEGFDPAEMNDKITQIENDGLSSWTDSYNEGQVMNRLIQTARIADETGDIEARDKMIATIKERLEDWLKAESGEVAFLFYYNDTWSTMLGYPAGHGQDNNINDHHFHWGYFIHAAAFMEQFEPGWANQYGDMINLLIRDASSPDRNDPLFPFLRNFSPYAGHSWANGFATFPFGNDQESTSESMQFASSLIHWGTITENDEIRDLGIYIYTTEQTAVEEYWFDIHKRNFKPEYGYSVASRVWGNGYDNQTFWTSDIEAAYGIELYPIHGGSLYLGHHQSYAESLWAEITQNTGILNNEENPNLWHDTYWKYLAMIDPQTAIELYDSYPDRNLKFGISDAHTYHWLHALNALGTVNTSITANYPIAASFTKDGIITYVAHNYSDAPITITFSDGYQLEVPARQMVNSKEIEASGVLSASFYQAFPNGSVDLRVDDITAENVTKVEFFDGNQRIGEDLTAPYQITADQLVPGIHNMYAKIVVGEQFNVTNIIKIQVGEQVPFSGNASEIPGTIQAGNYDSFEGGVGQNIAYFDSSQSNEGGYRPDEYVDAALVQGEGAIVGWITSGEWLEYSIDVQASGYYDVNLRYASGNGNGGGPFHFEIDGNPVSPVANLPSTTDWESFQNFTMSDVQLTEGQHVLRLQVNQGEFNLGEMHFTYDRELDFVAPVADSGNNVEVVLPATSATLNGSGSYHPEEKAITYNWEQVFGPSVMTFDNDTSMSPNISNLVEGVYKVELTVSDGSYSATDEVLILVSEDGNVPPSISISSPSDGDNFVSGETVSIQTMTSDVNGTIDLVEFYMGSTKIGEADTAPFSFDYEFTSEGSYELTAVATDNDMAQTTSRPISVEVTELSLCSETSAEAQQGAFSTGYEVTFETVGENVTITFELLDTDKQGVIAYLWEESPFSEEQMDNVDGLKFSKTITGLEEGTTISYACKFAFAGGLAVTDYFSYTVGEHCETLSVESPKPTSITMYPNPASSVLHFDSKEQPITKIEVYNVLGMQMLECQDNCNTINVETLSSGLYLIKIFSESEFVLKKVVIE